MYNIEDLSKRSLIELGFLIAGDSLGRGMSRTTYRLAIDNTKVIKIENSVNHFQNVLEWDLWSKFQYDSKVSQWLTPCRYISDSGTFLIMDYAKDITAEELPKLIPQFITDRKIENFGMLNGRVVVRDYGCIIPTLSLRLTK